MPPDIIWQERTSVFVARTQSWKATSECLQYSPAGRSHDVKMVQEVVNRMARYVIDQRQIAAVVITYFPKYVSVSQHRQSHIATQQLLQNPSHCTFFPCQASIDMKRSSCFHMHP